MRKHILSATLCTFFGVGVLAASTQTQDRPNTSQRESAHRHQADPQRQVSMLSKKLNLSDDQKNQILPILSDRQQQMKSIHEDSSLSPQDRRAKMRSIREESDAKIKALLNDDQ